jgi:Cys-tRNA synthase (O-phospho-L-seryl-tRNA:Cys-tRNA synthase)
VHVPKKRGRKKKVQPTVVEPVGVSLVSGAKVFTVPRTQTYENYTKHYSRIMEETKEKEGQEVALIFDKFNEPELYQELLDHVNCDPF